MFITPENRASQFVEDTWQPRSTFGDYIGSTALLQLIENPFYKSAMEGQVRKAEFEQYKNTIENPRNAWSLGIKTVEELSGQRTGVVPTLNEEQFLASKDYRKGMKFREGISPARLAIEAEEYDRVQALKKDVDLYEGGILSTGASWLAMAAAETLNPFNYITLFAPGGTIVKAGIYGAVENMTIEVAQQLVTSRQRAEVGLAMTPEERIQSIAFAGLLGGVFGSAGKAWRNKKERVDAVRRDQQRRIQIAVAEEKRSLMGMVDKTTQFLDVTNKRKILQNLSESLDDTAMPRIREYLNPKAEPDQVPNVLSAQDAALSRMFSGDRDAARSLIESSGAPVNEQTIKALIPERQPELDPHQPSTKENAQRILSLTEDKKMSIADDQDIDIKDVKVEDPVTESYLEGDTLFEVADRKTENLSKGIDEAAKLFSRGECV